MIHHAVILTVTGNDFWHNHAQPHQWWEWVAFRSPMMLLDQGISAVYLFFVLSGFVLALPWFSGRHQSYPTFIIRRVCRIYIPYLASMLFSVLLLLAVGHPVISNVSTFYASIWHSALDVSTFGRTLAVETDNSLNFPTWTIAWELRIALIFPLLLAPVVFLKRNGLLLSLVVMLVACIGLRVAGPVAAEFGRVAYAYIALFIMGAALASIVDRIQTFEPGSTLLTMALLGLGASLLFPVWSTKPLVAFVPLGAGSMLVMIAALRTGWFSSFLQRDAALAWEDFIQRLSDPRADHHCRSGYYAGMASCTDRLDQRCHPELCRRADLLSPCRTSRPATRSKVEPAEAERQNPRPCGYGVSKSESAGISKHPHTV